MTEPLTRGDLLSLINCILDSAIVILLTVWFTLDRCNIYFRKDKSE